MRSYHRLVVAFLFLFATIGTHLIQATPLPFEVKIEQTELLTPGDTAHVRVTLDQAPFDIGAFDFTIAVDASILTLVDVTPGSLFFDQGECDWEYFTFSDFPNDTIYHKTDSNFIRSVRVVGIASTIQSGPPACYLPDLSSPATLFTLHYVQASDNSDCMKSAAPVRFLWNTCADNVFSVVDGSQLILSDKVNDVDTAGYIEFSDHYNSPFPTYQGTQYDQCVPTGPVPASDQFIDFYNGMVRYDCTPTFTLPGDLNLNDIPFELADWIVYSNFFIEGLSAFTIDSSRQIANSDVNQDGHPLTLVDLNYTGRKAFNLGTPPGGLTFHWQFHLSADGVLKLPPNEDMIIYASALMILIDGEVTPELLADQMTMHYRFENGVTKVFIYSPDMSERVRDEPIIGNVPPGSAIAIEGATYIGGRIIGTVIPEVTPITVRIDNIENWGDDDPMEVPVYIENNSTPIGGFDLLIAYDGRTLGVTDVTPGEHYFETCEWEYFTYRTGPQIGGDTLPPSGLVRVVAVAEVNDCCHHPLCYVTDAGQTPLFTINLKFIQDREHVNCAFSPIQFYWTSCADNSISDYTGNELYIAGQITDELPPFQLSNPNVPGGYPTNAGPQNADCYTGDIDKFPQPIMTLHNGGIDFICIDPIDITGDVNLNGIAYEIADWILFSNYFTQDLSVFTIDETAQSEATDVTLDSLELSIYDLVYMGRVIQGDAYPHPDDWINHPHGSAEVNINPDTDILSVETTEEMGGAYFIFAGQVTPNLLQSDMDLSYLYDPVTNQTKVLIASLEGESFAGGDLLGNITTDQILHMEIATSESYIIDLHTAPDNDSRMRVRIESRQNVPLVSQQPVAVMMDHSDFEVGGFDFLIAYDATIFNLNSVEMGQFLADSCQWEYFTYRTDVASGCSVEPCPSGLVRIVSIAEINNGEAHPTCFTPDPLPAELFTMNFGLSVGPEVAACNFFPFSFYWQDCADNALATDNGYDIIIADSVIAPDDPYGSIANPNDPNGYPTFAGPQDSDCFTVGQTNAPLNRMTLINGGIEFLCDDTLETIGDVNFNGIAFEVGDWVLFSNYFIYGMQVFLVNPINQEVNSDVNQDGKTLQLDDYVQLGLIVFGAGSPSPGPADRVTFNLDDNGVMSVKSNLRENLSAVQIVIKGEIDPILLADQMNMGYDYDSTNTSILIFSYEMTSSIGKEVIASGFENSVILSIRGASVDGREVIITVDRDVATDVGNPPKYLPLTYSVGQNFPNPFNPSTTIQFDLPKASTVEFDVINIMGQTVYHVTDFYSAGSHSIEWNAETQGHSVASGVYYYRIKAGDFSETRKMILLK